MGTALYKTASSKPDGVLGLTQKTQSTRLVTVPTSPRGHCQRPRGPGQEQPYGRCKDGHKRAIVVDSRVPTLAPTIPIARY
ncbi:hypothetical protein ACMYSQ_005947 [Aspergillus niger]